MSNSVFHKVWGMPIWLSAITMFGLISAIMAHGGVWHWLSWLLLAWPIYVMFKYSKKAFK